MERESELRSKILEEYDRGKICFATIDGICSIDIDKALEKPLNDILYDINRNKATILASINDVKWVNDLALTTILENYYNKVMTQKEKLLKATQLALYLKGIASALERDAEDYDMKFPLQYAVELRKHADEFLNLK